MIKERKTNKERLGEIGALVRKWSDAAFENTDEVAKVDAADAVRVAVDLREALIEERKARVADHSRATASAKATAVILRDALARRSTGDKGWADGLVDGLMASLAGRAKELEDAQRGIEATLW